jgi:hypothetical protein
VLRSVGVGVIAGLAGCSDEDPNGGDDSNGGGPSDETGTPTETPPDIITPQEPDIDPPDDPDPLDPGQFQTYENDSFGYSLSYPGNWTIDDSQENQVLFTAPEDSGLLIAYAIELEDPIESFEVYVQTTADEFGEIEGVERLGTERVTLPDDRHGFFIDLRVTETTVFRTRLLMVQRTPTRFYLCQLSIPEEIYTDETDSLVRDILTSFTLLSDGPGNPGSS